MSFKSLFIVLLAFCIGTGVGMSIMRPLTVPGNAFDPAFRDKMQALASSDLEEYYRLKTAEEKYQKADEILGKIMQIFLADLALHVSGEAQEAAKVKFVSETPSAQAPSPSPVPAFLSHPAEKESEPVVASNWKQSEDKLLATRNERDIETALKEVRISNLDGELKNTSRFMNKTGLLNTLNGKFGGTARVTVKEKTRDWDIFMELAGSILNNELNGKVKIQLIENGKPFSTTSGNGGLGQFREFSKADSKTLLVRAGSEYFQLYHLKDLNQLVGNVYHQESDDDPYEYIGTITLRRQ